MQEITVKLYKRIKVGPAEYLGLPSGVEHKVPLDLGLEWIRMKIAAPLKQDEKFVESLLKA